MKVQPGGQPQKLLCVINYHSLNSLFSAVVKAHSKVQGVLSMVPLAKIDGLYAMLNVSTVYSLLDCTSGYHPIVLSPGIQNKLAFVTLTGKFEFKQVHFSLAVAPVHFYS